MTSHAATVDEYLAEVPPERLEALKTIRQLCHEHLVSFSESMTYGMPSYSRDGAVEVAFASQKQNIALYILRTDVLEPFRGRFTKSALGKGCVRYRNPAKIDYSTISEMLEKTEATRGEVC